MYSVRNLKSSSQIFIGYPRHLSKKVEQMLSTIRHIFQVTAESSFWPQFVSYPYSESRSVMSDSLRLHGLYSPWNSQARILEWVAFPFSRVFSQPGDGTQVSCIAGGFFTRWATGKTKYTGVGSLSLLQRIFLTQELNWGLLHCRQILYQLSYDGSPFDYFSFVLMVSFARHF